MNFCEILKHLIILAARRFMKFNKNLKGQPTEVFHRKKACNFIEKSLQHKFFPVDIAKFLGTPFLKNICNGCF